MTFSRLLLLSPSRDPWMASWGEEAGRVGSLKEGGGCVDLSIMWLWLRLRIGRPGSHQMSTLISPLLIFVQHHGQMFTHIKPIPKKRDDSNFLGDAPNIIQFNSINESVKYARWKPSQKASLAKNTKIGLNSYFHLSSHIIIYEEDFSEAYFCKVHRSHDVLSISHDVLSVSYWGNIMRPWFKVKQVYSLSQNVYL